MSATFEPAYLTLLRSGELDHRVEQAFSRLDFCDLCAWRCRVARSANVRGVCGTGVQAYISGYCAHMGEEGPLSGWGGSGTIFFARCNLRCQYCQNYTISQPGAGQPVEPARLAEIMLELQSEGCHNINLVSPSHVIAPILAAVAIAARAGLRLPLVYNTGGYDSLTGLALLDGVIDIYMPDMKYASPSAGRLYSKAPRYPEVNQAAVREMHRQVGDLQIDARGLAQRGLLVRHLVLPNGQAGSEQIIRFLADEISTNTYLSLMDQYHPDYMVRRSPGQFPKLARPLRPQEYEEAVQIALAAGLQRIDDSN